MTPSTETEPGAVAGTARGPGQLSAHLLALVASKEDGTFRMRDIFDALSGRGHAALLVVFSLPNLIPGLSPIFGPVLAFIGLRIAFAQRPWLPRWLLDKPMKRASIEKLAAKCAAIERRTRKLLRPRLTRFCRNTWAERSHGLTVFVLGVLLALPLPVPGSNVAAALPIVILGLALLEDDGLYVIVGYVGAWFGVGYFTALVLLGRAGLIQLWHAMGFH